MLEVEHSYETDSAPLQLPYKPIPSKVRHGGGPDPSQWWETPLHPGQQGGPIPRMAIELVSNTLWTQPGSLQRRTVVHFTPVDLELHLGASVNPPITGIHHFFWA